MAEEVLDIAAGEDFTLLLVREGKYRSVFYGGLSGFDKCSDTKQSVKAIVYY